MALDHPTAKKETQLALMQMPETQSGGQLLAITAGGNTGSPQKVNQTTHIADARDYNELMDEYSLH